MNIYMVAIHSAFDGYGESIKLVKIHANTKDDALLFALSNEGWVANSIQDLDSIPDTAWSEPYFLETET